MSPYPPARTIPWHGQEWLIRVEPCGSIVVPRTAGIGAELPQTA